MAHYPFDGSANDNAGENHGTIYGNITFAPGAIGQAAKFGGGTAFVKVPSSEALQLGQASTLAAWVRIAPELNYADYFDQHGYPEILSKGARFMERFADYGLLVTSQAHFPQTSADGLFTHECVPDGGGVAWCWTDSPIPQGEWHHVAATFDQER